MEVRFRTRKWEKAYRNSKDGQKLLGAERYRRFVQRIDIISEAQSIDELSKLPVLHWHPLKGNLAGQFAVTLTGNWRLILTVVADTPNAVCVEEVIDYHGD